MPFALPFIIPSPSQPHLTTVTIASMADKGEGKVTFVEPRMQSVPVLIVPHMFRTNFCCSIFYYIDCFTSDIGFIHLYRTYLNPYYSSYRDNIRGSYKGPTADFYSY